jgi:hypothetical protein
MPTGANVTNAANTRKALNGASSGGDLTVIFNDFGPQTGSGKKQNVDWVRTYAPRYGPSRKLVMS